MQVQHGIVSFAATVGAVGGWNVGDGEQQRAYLLVQHHHTVGVQAFFVPELPALGLQFLGLLNLARLSQIPHLPRKLVDLMANSVPIVNALQPFGVKLQRFLQVGQRHRPFAPPRYPSPHPFRVSANQMNVKHVLFSLPVSTQIKALSPQIKA